MKTLAHNSCWYRYQVDTTHTLTTMHVWMWIQQPQPSADLTDINVESNWYLMYEIDLPYVCLPFMEDILKEFVDVWECGCQEAGASVA